MRYSQYLLNTVKESPADAEIVSHKLMLRTGMIKKVAAGIYNYLPFGLRAIRKVEQIIREEMNRAGDVHRRSRRNVSRRGAFKPLTRKDLLGRRQDPRLGRRRRFASFLERGSGHRTGLWMAPNA
jgi:hypothetical protein